MFNKIKEMWTIAKYQAHLLFINKHGGSSIDNIVEISFAILFFSVIGIFAITRLLNATTGDATVDAVIPVMAIIIVFLVLYGLYKGVKGRT